MKEKVLITGGTGMIGSRLTHLLIFEGYDVVHLSRSINSKLGVKTFEWNLKNKTIDTSALNGVDYVIHLAGAGISDKPWTNKYRKEIVTSRIDGISLIKDLIEEKSIKLKAFISASGVNYYGSKSIRNNVTEEDEAGDDFLARTCVYWENYADKLMPFTRVVKLRTGIVLDAKQGAYPKLSEPFKYGFGMALGSGEQYMPWIHIDDLCQMYLHAIKTDSMSGSYNACIPKTPTNMEFSKAISKTKNKRMWLPNLPSFIIKIIFGDMADLFLYGNECLPDKVIEAGFSFKYSKLKDALGEISKK